MHRLMRRTAKSPEASQALYYHPGTVARECLKGFLVMSIFSRLSLAVLLMLISVTARAEIISGQVIGIVDGDTLVFVDVKNQQHMIRLAGIDAPEKEQNFGQRARTSLSAMSADQKATADCRKRGPNRHEICVVTVGGKDLGLEQVRAGMAWRYRQDIAQQTAQERANYQQAEFDAKIHRLGLWTGVNPTPPWDWRHGGLGD